MDSSVIGHQCKIPCLFSSLVVRSRFCLYRLSQTMQYLFHLVGFVLIVEFVIAWIQLTVNIKQHFKCERGRGYVGV
jgi:hypothetical protein